VVSFHAVEEVCESKRTTLVIHPTIRRAIKGYEESFYVGLRCFLAGESDGLYFLPLQGAGYVRLVFSRRVSSGGHNLLRIDPLTKEGLAQIKASLD
jgi:hypothetical protein